MISRPTIYNLKPLQLGPRISKTLRRITYLCQFRAEVGQCKAAAFMQIDPSVLDKNRQSLQTCILCLSQSHDDAHGSKSLR